MHCGDVSNGGTGYKMDALTYNYNRTSDGQLIDNKLKNVDDPINAGYYTTDIDGQAANYYSYDRIGNIIQEGTGMNVDKIYWTVYGKIKQIERLSNSPNDRIISYKYDASGNRIVKSVQIPGNNTQYTFYVRDAKGNVLGVYTRYVPAMPSPNDKYTTKWAEQHLYGSSRLGMWRPNLDVTTTWTAPGPGNGQINLGERLYEIGNHLDNVLATISDSRTGIDVGNNGTIDYYEANVITASDYYPFGMQMPGRIFNSGIYRYGFNAKENDNEVKGDGNQQDYGMRTYDVRIGRFFSIDPLTKSFPWYTPYQFAGNNPIESTDLDGGEPQYAKKDQERKDMGITKWNQGIELARDKGTIGWFSIMHYPTAPHVEFYWKNNDGTPGIYNPSTAYVNGKHTGYWQRYETFEQKQAKIASDRSIYYLFAGAIVFTPALVFAPALITGTGNLAMTTGRVGMQALRWTGTNGLQAMRWTGTNGLRFLRFATGGSKVGFVERFVSFAADATAQRITNGSWSKVNWISSLADATFANPFLSKLNPAISGITGSLFSYTIKDGFSIAPLGTGKERLAFGLNAGFSTLGNYLGGMTGNVLSGEIFGAAAKNWLGLYAGEMAGDVVGGATGNAASHEANPEGDNDKEWNETNDPDE